ncbi:MAG: DUF6252 family protein [Nonlabens sp.]|uniref:DUF6252 family protein n=1 Tax=Nonlabens sp. TaxID=1888209 RepID=UPI003EF8F551
MRLIKQFLLCSLALIAFTACEDNLEDDNIPAIQAVRNGEFFKSTQMTAVANTDGTVTITGVNRLERLELNLESATAGTYPLGSGAPNEAVYTFNDTDVYSTNNSTGTGQVVLSAGTPAGTLTGTFSFVSYLPMNADSLYMRKGVIFQVPFGNPIGSGGGGSSLSSFAAQVDGTAFTPSVISPVNASGIIVVNASNGANSIVLNFPDTIVPGTYALAGSGMYTANYISGGSAVPAVSGTLIITAADPAANSVTGTFSFMTGPPNNFDITNGAFTIFY